MQGQDMNAIFLTIGTAIAVLTTEKFDTGAEIAQLATSYLRCSPAKGHCSMADQRNVGAFNDWIDVIYTSAQDARDRDFFCGPADRLSNDDLARRMAKFVSSHPKLWSRLLSTDVGLLALGDAYGCSDARRELERLKDQ